MDIKPVSSKVKIAAIGSAAANILSSVPTQELKNTDVLAIDTDSVALSQLSFPTILIGKDKTDGLGTGGDSELGKEAALADSEILDAFTKDTDALVILCGLGGGTGSIVAPMLCKLAESNGVKFIVSICIMPIEIEGSERVELANSAFKYLKKRCDATFKIENSKFSNSSLSELANAFGKCNTEIASTLGAIGASISRAGLVNTDIATFKKIFKNSQNKHAFLIQAKANGEDSITSVISNLFDSPAVSELENSTELESALVAFSCPHNFDMTKMQTAIEAIGKKFGILGKLKFSLRTNESQDNSIEIVLMGACVLPKSPEVEQNHDTPITESKTNDTDSRKEESDSQAQPEPSNTEKPKKKIRRFFPFANKIPAPQPVQLSQGEFEFVESSSRGFFSDTQPNVRFGEDLDVPTFMRKKTKITP